MRIRLDIRISIEQRMVEVVRAVADEISRGSCIVQNPDDLIVRVGEYYKDIGLPDILVNDKRTERTVAARYAICYLLRQNFSLSLKEIGERLNGRAHTTVLHALRRVEDCLKKYPVGSSNGTIY